MIFGQKLKRAAAITAVVASVSIWDTALAQQQQPTPEAVETARQIITLKGGDTLFNTLIPGVIEQGKYMFEQQNPNLGKELRDVTAKLRADYAPRQAQLTTEIAKIYASHFSEKEIKDVLAFYQSPLGRKLIIEEPKALDNSMSYAQNWARTFSDEVIRKMREEMKKLGHDI
jgi:uncharacterized protein